MDHNNTQNINTQIQLSTIFHFALQTVVRSLVQIINLHRAKWAENFVN